MVKKNNKPRANFYDAYLNVFASLFEIRLYLILVLVVFIFSSFAGFYLSDQLSFLDNILREIAMKVQGLGLFQLILFIFKNNLSSAFFALIFGFFMGIIPIFNAVLNGAILGYVVSRASSTEGLSVIWRLVPHGIFELPAVFISIALGIWIGAFVFNKNPKSVLLYRLNSSFRIFVYLVIPLLAVAALIEGVLIILF